MSLSVSNDMVCYASDPSTGKVKRGTLDRSEFMRLLAEAEEEARSTPLGNGTLTDQEVRELAGKYDPRHMSQTEYSSFIDYLTGKNVLSTIETYDIGLYRVVLRPGCFVSARVVPDLPRHALSIRTLKDADGDAICWADLMLQWCNRNSESDRIRAGALQKISRILRQMDSLRKTDA